MPRDPSLAATDGFVQATVVEVDGSTVVAVREGAERVVRVPLRECFACAAADTAELTPVLELRGALERRYLVREELALEPRHPARRRRQFAASAA